MRIVSRAILVLLFLAAPVMGQVKLDAQTREALSWQIALEREGFSPGIIDGKSGPKLALATSEYQRRFGLKVTGTLDAATGEALGVGKQEPIQTYAVRARDEMQVTGTIPKDWVAKSKLSCLGYTSMTDVLAEEFHCTQELLRRLNPDIKLDAVFCQYPITVPAVDIENPKRIRATRLKIHLGQKVIRVLDREGRVAALFHCSIAKDEAKRPSGTANVVTVISNPTYLFDPAMWPEVKNVNQKLLIPPGPRNPVGVCWIALSLPGYGIHGTPTPEMIGKTGSHGCFRLTNWDAQRLGGMVEAGMGVEFVK
ncbi:MAG TPA: L,D-transpeptidase [Tepidisphaeraceae bacterium]|nr:L,D-transpeptidase [Tepidisphaeraceae bacterium]